MIAREPRLLVSMIGLLLPPPYAVASASIRHIVSLADSRLIWIGFGGGGSGLLVRNDEDAVSRTTCLATSDDSVRSNDRQYSELHRRYALQPRARPRQIVGSFLPTSAGRAQYRAPTVHPGLELVKYCPPNRGPIRLYLHMRTSQQILGQNCAGSLQP